ncbi:outer membrane beta-barrel protein [bacterium]|nr:outer membrane beta-barrel protein [bacterium]
MKSVITTLIIAIIIGFNSDSTAYAKGLLFGGVEYIPLISTHWTPKDKIGDYEVEIISLKQDAGGFNLTLEIRDRFHLQYGFYHVNKGCKHKVIIPDFIFGDMFVTYNFDYFEFPVMLKVDVLRYGKLRLITSFGCYFGQLNYSSYKFENAILGSIKENITEESKQTDFGLIFGNGVEIWFEKAFIALKYRFSMGFVDIPLPTGPGMDCVELRNNCHTFVLGINYLLF